MSTWLGLAYAFNNGFLLVVSLMPLIYQNDYKIYFLVGIFKILLLKIAYLS